LPLWGVLQVMGLTGLPLLLLLQLLLLFGALCSLHPCGALHHSVQSGRGKRGNSRVMSFNRLYLDKAANDTGASDTAVMLARHGRCTDTLNNTGWRSGLGLRLGIYQAWGLNPVTSQLGQLLRTEACPHLCSPLGACLLLLLSCVPLLCMLLLVLVALMLALLAGCFSLLLSLCRSVAKHRGDLAVAAAAPSATKAAPAAPSAVAYSTNSRRREHMEQQR
jgi:hypothetical protein